MNNLMLMLLNGLGGLLLGTFFYVGLYWTVKKGLVSKHPGLLFSSSFMIRTAVVLSGVLLLTQGVFASLMACLAGLILSRFLVFILDKTHRKSNQLDLRKD